MSVRGGGAEPEGGGSQIGDREVDFQHGLADPGARLLRLAADEPVRAGQPQARPEQAGNDQLQERGRRAFAVLQQPLPLHVCTPVRQP